MCFPVHLPHILLFNTTSHYSGKVKQHFHLEWKAYKTQGWRETGARIVAGVTGELSALSLPIHVTLFPEEVPKHSPAVNLAQ